ncbi:DUF2442 domain-containing protein [Oleomonas cavernae]|uniref:DUF2442 domain-containing protein n=1 Tax=Oleomonas cavernae TaxID=2320859 RepID=A0A418WGH5_9PROT|nr:DUF2442 domain-containing protein [Oleomonas cavernae]RJF89131.1 DUF2442 domain-containing protein [Oleomonas cavernae]
MSALDQMRTIGDVHPVGTAMVDVSWVGGVKARLDLGAMLHHKAFAALRDPAAFREVRVGEWGHALEWPGGVEIGADALWLETLSATGHEDARKFLEWRLRHGLSLTKAAEALGLSRRMIAYYSNGKKPVPKHVLLACRGWEATAAA